MKLNTLVSNISVFLHNEEIQLKKKFKNSREIVSLVASEIFNVIECRGVMLSACAKTLIIPTAITILGVVTLKRDHKRLHKIKYREGKRSEVELSATENLGKFKIAFSTLNGREMKCDYQAYKIKCNAFLNEFKKKFEYLEVDKDYLSKKLVKMNQLSDTEFSNIIDRLDELALTSSTYERQIFDFSEWCRYFETASEYRKILKLEPDYDNLMNKRRNELCEICKSLLAQIEAKN